MNLPDQCNSQMLDKKDIKKNRNCVSDFNVEKLHTYDVLIYLILQDITKRKYQNSVKEEKEQKQRAKKRKLKHTPNQYIDLTHDNEINCDGQKVAIWKTIDTVQLCETDRYSAVHTSSDVSFVRPGRSKLKVVRQLLDLPDRFRRPCSLRNIAHEDNFEEQQKLLLVFYATLTLTNSSKNGK